MLNFITALWIFSMVVLALALVFMLYIMAKYVGTDILMFLQRRSEYKFKESCKRAEAKNRHPSAQRNIFDQEQYID